MAKYLAKVNGMSLGEPQSAADEIALGALALRFLGGDLSPAERAAFAERLRNDAAARETFLTLCVDAGRFAEALAADQLTTGDLDLEAGEFLVAPAVAQATQHPWRRAAARLTRPGAISLLVSALAVGVLLAVLAWSNVPVARPTNFRWAAVPAESQFVARLVRPPTARWARGAPSFADGTLLLAGQQLDLAEGTIDVIFNDGAQVTLAGRAQFVVVSPDRGRLDAGRLTSFVPPQAVGFAIRTSQVEVVDLGTEFGMVAGSSGQTEVHVFRGAVRIEAYDAELRRTLRAGQALTILPSGQLLAAAAQPKRFVRRTPAAAPGVADDEPNGPIIDDFDGSAQHAGWAGPWALHGAGRVQREVEEPLGEGAGAYLRVQPTNAEVRTLNREYRQFGDIDPSQPHTIRWKWRFDGDPRSLTNFHDRIHFFSEVKAYPGTTFSAGWLIGIAYGAEGEARPPVGEWFFFDSHKSGRHSDKFVTKNMVETGLRLRPGAVYQFEVRVDPAAGTYGATIDDGDDQFSAEGLHFRGGQPGAKGVLHFGGCASAEGENHAFSLDAIEIRASDLSAN